MTPEPPVLLTRSRADNARLARLLRERGVASLSWTTTVARVLCPDGGTGALRRSVESADVVAFTSRRGALALRALLGRETAALLRSKRVAAVGAGTSALLERWGLRPEWIGGGGADELALLLQRALPTGTRVTLVRGADAEEEPAGTLREAGLLVDDRRVYRQDEPPPPRCEPRPLRAVVCASPSAARRALRWHPWIAVAPFVAIGTTTAIALRDLGVRDVRIASSATPEALCDAVAAT